MLIPTGKGMFIWQIPRCGDPIGIALLAKSIGLSHVFIKIADGVADFGIINGHDLAKQLSDALKIQGIEPWGWQYVYLASPANEAAKGIERVNETGVIGFVMDAETQAKDKPAAAHTYCDKLRIGIPNMSVGLSSFRFPSLHPELPWAEFRRICDFDMPQVYWCQAHNPGFQLQKSYNEFAAMAKKLPYVATGAAYREFGWQPTLSEVTEFMTVANDLKIPFNFWEWYDAYYVLPDIIWDTIAEWKTMPPEDPPPLPSKVRVTANVLNVRLTPGGTLVGYVPFGTIFGVTGQANDNTGKKWWKVGSCYVASWYTELVE